MSRRPVFDIAAGMRQDQARWDEHQRDRQAGADFLAAQPTRPVRKIEVGTTIEELAEQIDGYKRAFEPALAILVGRRELKRLRAMDGAEGHFEFWPGGEVTFDQIPLVVRRGAGPVAVFNDIMELDAAVRDLPQPMLPPGRRGRR